MTVKNKKITSILFLLISVGCFAQQLPPPGPPPPGFPIDGGVLIGVFVAVCYGVKKILKNN